MPRPIPLPLLALASLAATLACAQTAPPPTPTPSPQSAPQTPAPRTPQAHADKLRRYIVDQYATPELRAAFNQPAPQSLDSKQAIKKSKNMDEYLKLVYNSMPPHQIFTIAFARGLGSILMNLPLDLPSTTASTPPKLRRSALVSILARLAEQAPVVGDYAGSAVTAAGTARAKAAEEALNTKVLASRGKSNMSSAQLFVDLILPPSEAEQYQRDPYPQKAAKLFKASALSLRQLPFPNGMVLYLCEVPGRHGAVSTGEDVRENAEIFAPGDPRFKEDAWSRMTEEEKWRILTDGAQHYFDETTSALADPGRSAAAIDSIPATLEGPVEHRVLEALGPEGLTAYQAAKGTDKTTISAAANAIHAAYQFLVMLNLGAPAEPPTSTASSF